MSIKKILLSVIMLLTIISGFFAVAWAGPVQELAVEKILAGSNTDPASPAINLLDNNTATTWLTRTSDNEQLTWLQIELKEAASIDSIQLFGLPAGREMRVEYEIAGNWRGFSSTNHLSTDNLTSGWNTIDLTGDRVVSKKLRLVIKGTGVLGKIGELKVIGSSVSVPVQRIELQKSTGNGSNICVQVASNLIDGNTYTTWQGSNNDLVEFELGKAYSVKRIKVFGSNANAGNFALEYQYNGRWYSFANTGFLKGSDYSNRWNSFDVSNDKVVTDRVRIRALSNGCDFGEIEVWGVPNAATSGSTREVYYGSNNNFTLTSGSKVMTGITLPSTDYPRISAELNFDVYDMEASDSLSYSINGGSWHTIASADASNKWKNINLSLTGEKLIAGINAIAFKASGGDSVNISNVQLNIIGRNDEIKPVAYTVNGQNVTWPADNLGYTGPKETTGSLIMELGTSYAPDSIYVYKKDTSWQDNATYTIEADVQGNWINIGTFKAQDLVHNWQQLPLTQTAVGVKRVRLNWQGSVQTGLGEVVLFGSKVNDGAPTISITSPKQGDTVKKFQHVEGIVDNKIAKVTVNGVAAQLIGHNFQADIEIDTAGKDKARTITVIATDGQGQTGQTVINVLVNISGPVLTIVQPIDGFATNSDKVTITGSVDNNATTVKVNNTVLQVKGRQFSGSFNLDEGHNYFRIVATDNLGYVTEKLLTVKRDSKAPLINLNEPLPNKLINSTSIDIAGTVADISQVKVTVNGKAATVTGDGFVLSGLGLQEGKNAITIVATDELGQSTTLNDVVIIDSTPPKIEITSPEDGKYFKTQPIEVKGKATDANMAFVAVNGKLTTVMGDDYVVQGVTLKEGWNDVNATAYDAAGNTASKQIRVLLDRVAPVAFTPVADPAGWTSNTTPTITFSTTDATSGIDHYELKLDDGKYEKATSPYVLPKLTDGEHTIYIKAVDKVGWETVGTVKVYIDTTPPVLPTGLKLVSGTNKMGVLLDGNPEDDVTRYILERNPAFPNGQTVTLSRDENGVQYENKKMVFYADMTVLNNNVYSYRVKAVDHAGNESQYTEFVGEKVGVAEKKIDAQGGTVSFENVAINVPADTIFGEKTIIISPVAKEDTQPTAEKHAAVGGAYDFKIKDGDTLYDHAKFDKPLTITMAYKEEIIPEGFTENDLAIYYYDDMLDHWVRIYDAMLLPEANIMIFKMNHFTRVEFQAIKAEDTLPDPGHYSSLGLDPAKSYFEDNQAFVSPSNGNLTIKGVDFRIPGKKGFKFEFTRIYDNTAYMYSKINKDLYPIEGLKNGWRFDLPWLEKDDNGQVVHLLGGSAQKIDWQEKILTGFSGVYRRFENHQGEHFILEEKLIQRGDRKYSYVLTSKDGTHYYFNSNGTVGEIADYNDVNCVYIDYDSINTDSNHFGIGYNTTDNKVRIAKIHTNSGREITFEYDGTSLDLLKSVTYNGKKIKYAWNGDDEFIITDEVNRQTKYHYSGAKDITYGAVQKAIGATMGITIFPVPEIYWSPFVSYRDDQKTKHVRFIEKVEYPTGAYTTYESSVESKINSWQEDKDGFGFFSFNWSALVSNNPINVFSIGLSYWYAHFWLDIRLNMITVKKVEKHPANKPDSIVSLTNYDYELATKLEDGKTSVWASKTIMYAPKMRTEIYSTEDGLTTDKKIFLDGIANPIEETSYQYNNSLKLPTLETVKKGNRVSYTNEYRYDNWGNKTYQRSGTTGQETWIAYANTNANTPYGPVTSLYINDNKDIDSSIHSLPIAQTTLNKLGAGNGDIYLQTVYKYNNKGLLKEEAKWDNTNKRWVKSGYEYYDENNTAVGTCYNLKKKIEAFGEVNQKESEYEYDSNGMFLTKIKLKGQVKDVDGKVIDTDRVTAEYGYYDDGLKKWEKDYRGFVTEYIYEVQH